VWCLVERDRHDNRPETNSPHRAISFYHVAVLFSTSTFY
jgi:hypothetical protein